MAVADTAYLDPAAFGHAYVITRVGEELTITITTRELPQI